MAVRLKSSACEMRGKVSFRVGIGFQFCGSMKSYYVWAKASTSFHTASSMKVP